MDAGSSRLNVAVEELLEFILNERHLPFNHINNLMQSAVILFVFALHQRSQPGEM